MLLCDESICERSASELFESAFSKRLRKFAMKGTSPGDMEKAYIELLTEFKLYQIWSSPSKSSREDSHDLRISKDISFHIWERGH